jgi:hypothetical protein
LKITKFNSILIRYFMKKVFYLTKISISLLGLSLFLVSCGTDDTKQVDPNSNSTTPGGNLSTSPGGNFSGTASALVISNGADNIEIGKYINFEALFVDDKGAYTAATGVTWTSSNTEVAEFTGNKLIGKSSGITEITAKATSNGKEVTAKVVVGVYQPTLFTVVPHAIIWTTGAGDIPLEPVYFGAASTTFSYTSSNTSVATVDATGKVSFVAPGTASITVEASGLDGKPKFVVPVLVLGEPTAPLPVTRVTINPAGAVLFKNQTLQLTARAFNAAGTEVTGETVVWSVENDSLSPGAVEVSPNGLVSAKKVGEAIVYATIKGIRAQSKIEVYPDTVMIVTPYYFLLGAGESKQLEAKVYKINRNTKTLDPNPIPNPGRIKWSVPTFGEFGFGLGIFDIATVSQTGLVTAKANATAGFSTIIEAYLESNPEVYGAALLTIKIPGLPETPEIPEIPEIPIIPEIPDFDPENPNPDSTDFSDLGL